MKTITNQLIDFIYDSPSVFHVIKNAADTLEKSGFTRLSEGEKWQLEKGKKYYVTRNDSSIIAFDIGENVTKPAFSVVASHSDSPSFKLKALPELQTNGYTRLNVEAYGGMIDSTWFDRPLGIAGRVFVKCGDKTESRLFDAPDAALIPNVAIHFNRNVNSGYAYNRQIDLCPMISAGLMQKGGFDGFISDKLGIKKDDIISKDLFLYVCEKGRVWGIKNEFVTSPRLDDLQCAFTSLLSLTSSHNKDAINVYVCFDNEEVGSGTKQGAHSDFLENTVDRICIKLFDEEAKYQIAADSFLISADNAHAVHPNHPEKTDAENRVFLNGGIVIKENAAQKYTTDASSSAVLRLLCEKAGVPYQLFANRSDIPGGSTLGNLSNYRISMNAADIGLPQLAMHSCNETAGSADSEYGFRLFNAFYGGELKQ